MSDFNRFMKFDDERLLQYARDENNQPTTDLRNFQSSYAEAGKNRSTGKLYATVVRAFLQANEWTFKAKSRGKSQESKIQDGALTTELLIKMMSVGSIHQRVILETMISTGARIGELSSVGLSDLFMECDPAELRIPGILTKNGTGVVCYLTSECKRYMQIWLLNRDEYLKSTANKARNLKIGGREDRLFGCSSALITWHFGYLVEKAGGAQKNINPAANGRKTAIRHPLHPHSCRKFFYSHALPALGEVMTHGLMNHRGGYLEEAYGRISPEERRALWKKNEHVLFITDAPKADLEKQEAVIAQLRSEMAELTTFVAELRRKGIPPG